MFIGIDLGTSSVKTILIDKNQNTLATKTESISIDNPQNGYYEQNPEERHLVWSQIVSANLNIAKKISEQ
jgi:sugar (pentulose or hexulose) kinase